MKHVKKIKARIEFIIKNQIGQNGVGYFIIKTKGEDGKKYDVLPSRDTDEYEAWVELVKDGVGKWFEGFQYQGEGRYGGIFNKHVLPHKLEEEKEQANTLL